MFEIIFLQNKNHILKEIFENCFNSDHSEYLKFINHTNFHYFDLCIVSKIYIIYPKIILFQILVDKIKTIRWMNRCDYLSLKSNNKITSLREDINNPSDLLPSCQALCELITVVSEVEGCTMEVVDPHIMVLAGMCLLLLPTRDHNTYTTLTLLTSLTDQVSFLIFHIYMTVLVIFIYTYMYIR